MKNNGFLFFLVTLYWVSIAFYNFFGLSVSKKLSSVHRTLVDACRTVVVWIVNIILYQATNGQYGEQWVTKSALIQLGGFLLMVFGTLVHNKIIKFQKLFDYSDLTVVIVSQPPTDENRENSLTVSLLEVRENSDRRK